MRRNNILILSVSIIILFPSASYAQSMYRIGEVESYDSIAKAEWNERNIERWRNMSEEEKAAFREKMNRWKNMDPEKKAEIKERYQRFKDLPEDERKKIRKNWRKFENLDPKKRKDLREKFGRWENMDPAKRKEMRERIEKFREMPPEERREMRKKFRELYRSDNNETQRHEWMKNKRDKDLEGGQYNKEEGNYNYKRNKR